MTTTVLPDDECVKADLTLVYDNTSIFYVSDVNGTTFFKSMENSSGYTWMHLPAFTVPDRYTGGTLRVVAILGVLPPQRVNVFSSPSRFFK